MPPQPPHSHITSQSPPREQTATLLSVTHDSAIAWGFRRACSEPSEAQITGIQANLYNSPSLLYNDVMTTMNVSEAREKLAEAIDAAQTEAVVLERYGRPAAVLVSMQRYEQLLDALEEAEDISSFDAAMAEEGDNIPWEQVKADLGWS